MSEVYILIPQYNSQECSDVQKLHRLLFEYKNGLMYEKKQLLKLRDLLFIYKIKNDCRFISNVPV